MKGLNNEVVERLYQELIGQKNIHNIEELKASIYRGFELVEASRLQTNITLKDAKDRLDYNLALKYNLLLMDALLQ